MWTTFSGSWNTVRLLRAAPNQTDHLFPMIHDACVLRCNAFYHSAFLSVHMPHMTPATVNSNMMHLSHNTHFVSSKLSCQFPQFITVRFLYDLHFRLWHFVTHSAHVLCAFFFFAPVCPQPYVQYFIFCQMFFGNTLQCRSFWVFLSAIFQIILVINTLNDKDFRLEEWYCESRAAGWKQTSLHSVIQPHIPNNPSQRVTKHLNMSVYVSCFTWEGLY